ncbi:MAG: radical SAM protein [Verrucomicrobiota bacterium]
MLLRLATRMMLGTDPRLLLTFCYNFVWKGMMSVEKFKRRLKDNVFFPPFLYISVINSCNLKCQGCWVDVEHPRTMIAKDELDKLITEAKEAGNSFFGLLGGEPFMHPQVLDVIEKHSDCYFQIFTNGQLITEKIAKRLRELGNVTPLISIEGDQEVSDVRRGKKDVYNKSMKGLLNCLNEKIITGVATSICQSNIKDFLTKAWLEKLIGLGVHYAWFHGYRPVGDNMTDGLALRPEQLRQVREFVVNMRAKMPIGIIDAYYDHEGKALCPMATGISHHISPTGSVEPCPIIQFASESIRDEGTIFEKLTQSKFLRDFREVTAGATRGCIMLERPDLVKDLVIRHDAKDTTLRKTALAELDRMKSLPSQYLREGEPIPEKHWMYKLAKRFWFYDFGMYEKHMRRSIKPEYAGKA